MRIFVILGFIAILAASGMTIVWENKPMPPYHEIMSEVINRAPITAYHNKFYGFKAQYPKCFIMQETGYDSTHAKFEYSLYENIAIEFSVFKNTMDDMSPDKWPVFAERKDTTVTKVGNDAFIVEGLLYCDGTPYPDHSRYAKYIRNGKLWFVYSVTYPNECHKAAERIRGLISQWHLSPTEYSSDLQQVLPYGQQCDMSVIM
ncbi:hypothetical protein [Xylanibacter muris]|uniref:Uncharacterized protein n=1 Tax=Xylanibacter muris TaxID=2736290 RepID=A0ABX2AMQ6_9BACT|nr:hypothetical protein [Xylanibacter muris]NPD92405.1 hypothetical protein [Xylanibacter muris]